MKHSLFFAFLIGVNILNAQLVYNKKDSLLVLDKLERLKNIDKHTSGEAIVAVGQWYLGTPYVEKTLEVAATEPLVINQSGLDCTTFVENALALSLLAQKKEISWNNFIKNLETIRYRNGVRSGYPSRLHYFSEWIKDNEKKGLVKDITADLGGVPLTKPINFMGTHRQLYPHLKDNDANYQQLLAIEQKLAKEDLCYIPQSEIKAAEKFIKTGDIVALATNIKGLDVTHTGILVKKPNGRVYLLHASSSQKKVVLSKEPLVDYLKKIKSNIGIIIARPQ